MGSATSFLCGRPVADRLSLIPSRSAQSSAACSRVLRERAVGDEAALEERRDPRLERLASAPSTSRARSGSPALVEAATRSLAVAQRRARGSASVKNS